MLTSTDIADQYARASDDDLRVLVVGAGIAGVTAAQMLRRQGRHPVLIERAEDDSHAGYMLALMPMVDPVLDDLGVRAGYRDHSVPLDRYRVRAHTGQMLREDSLAEILARFGDYRGIGRPELIDVLTAGGAEVTFDTTVAALTETSSGVVAKVETAGTAAELEFDLVMIADGIHSGTRDLVLGGRSVGVLDTNWGGWVAWAPEDDATDLGEELWGAGFFVGVYPVQGKLGVFVGGHRADTKAGPEAFVEAVRSKLTTTSPRFDSVLRAVIEDPDRYYWSLTDCRAPTWVAGRSVLLGDAAAGFLPTAGIGAGMAMESAWVLTRMLQHSRPDTLVSLLHAYERAQRPRVEAAQDNSRMLARLMLHHSVLLATLRDIAMRVTSVKVALRPIRRLLANRPDPDALA